MNKDAVIERLRSAMKGAVGEVRKDPEFAGKVVSTICTELGLDQLAGMYLANKFKSMVKEKTDG